MDKKSKGVTKKMAPSSSSKPKPKKTKTDDDETKVGDSASKKASYWKFKQRDGPQAPGSKEIPEGPEDCLSGLDFVITGVLDSIEREEAETLIKRHGGAVKTGISKKTTYLVAGRDAGETKMKKAKELKTKIIDEDGLFDLIRSKSASGASGHKASAALAKSSDKAVASSKTTTGVITLDDDEDADLIPPSKRLRTNGSSPSKKQATETVKLKSSTIPNVPAIASPSPGRLSVPSSTQSSSTSLSGSQKGGQSCSVLWVEKYKPKTLKNVIGQHGPASPANKLVPWLKNWYANRQKHGYKATSAGFFPSKGGDGGEFKAVLLSGPPGLGKTTTAILACEEAGFAYVHVNASDNRSKRILDNQFMEGVSSHSLFEYYSPSTSTGVAGEHDHNSALIMDEVDGMAGNEDRGGVAEVIQLIKNSKIPVICICNDRSSPKMRSLAVYCFDLRFQRPRVEQIRGAMMSVCAKEGIKIAPNALDIIIENSHHDVRQVLHNLYTWTVKQKSISFDEAHAGSVTSEKDSIKIGPFEACRHMFSAPKGKSPGSAINEKMDLYFEDYNFVPLFIYENYLNVQCHKARGKKETMQLVSRAADSFSLSDLVDREIRGKQNWSLLPIHAVFTAVIPGIVMEGHLQHQISFPSWLGKNSSTNKFKRLLQDLRTHMHLRVSVNGNGLNLEYLPVMRRCLTIPLVKHEATGVDEVVQFINAYDLQREDMESILELTTWDGMKDKEPLKNVPPSVKAALTRQLNKGAHQNPYSTATEVKKGRAKAGDDDTDLLDEETVAALASPDEEKEAEEDGVEKDSMIKVKKPKVAAPSKQKPKGESASSKPSTSGRGSLTSGRGNGKAGAAASSRRGKK